MAIRVQECGEESEEYRRLDVDFFNTRISTIVTSSANIVRKWLHASLYCRRHQRRKLIVGLGVQWIPSNSEAATMQICIGCRCLIFQLMNAETVPRRLRRFLSNRKNTFVGLWNHSDADKLLRSRHHLRMAMNPLDLRVHLTTRGRSLARASIETIVRECLGFDGVRLNRRICMSDWSIRNLSLEQILQACVDAYVSFEIGKSVKAWKI